MDGQIFNYSGPIVIFLMLMYSYYAYIVEVCLNKFIYIDKRYNHVYAIFFFYHIIFILILWSFFKVLENTEMEIPDMYKLNERFIEKFDALCRKKSQTSQSFTENTQLISEIDDPENSMRHQLNKNQKGFLEDYCKTKGLKLLTRTSSGNINICLKCKIIKPDRCHHCRKCDKCVLRMDHHCPYFNNCIGYTNQKYFTLFLIYLSIYIIFLLISIFPSFLQCWNYKLYNYQTEFHIFLMFIIGVCIFLPVISLLTYTLRLTAINKTSLEQEFAPFSAELNYFEPDLFDLGSCTKNYQEIFGKNFILALLPVWTTINNGYDYNKNNAINENFV